MNKFYQIKIHLQWLIAILMLSLTMGLFLWWLDALSQNLLLVFFMPLMPTFLQFLLSPFFKLVGVYQYLSPMLLVYNANDKKYDIHNGTPFDYLMLMSSVKKGAEFRKIMLIYYLEGLLQIIEKLESKELPDTVMISGSSYFFSNRTAEKFGFSLSKTSSDVRFNLLINYLDLVWMYSLSNGKLTFPNLSNIQTATTSGKSLLSKKPELLALHSYLNRNTEKNS